MKVIRKEQLLNSFPALPDDISEEMKGKGAKNYAVFLKHSYSDELFARCYHRYSNGHIIERQRYVFAKDGFVRYGVNYDGVWRVCKEFREPVFYAKSYGYNYDNSYQILNFNEIYNTCMKYSQLNTYSGGLEFEYLRLYCKYPNMEYLIKAGYIPFTEMVTGYWGGRTYLSIDSKINWKSNDLLKMLNLNRDEFKLLKGNEKHYDAYIFWRDSHPDYKPENLLALAKVCGFANKSLVEGFCKITGLTPMRMIKYLSDNDISFYDYRDYLEQCGKLEYNVHDTAICMPNDFAAMHTRLSSIIKIEADKKMKIKFAEHYEERKKLEYSSGELILRQPTNIEEIIEEGKRLNHCVGGYAERHATGILNIMFLRTADKPDVPYYTMEISNEGKIIQCRGFKNNTAKNPKPQRIIDFEKEYQEYLNKIFAKQKKRRKSA